MMPRQVTSFHPDVMRSMASATHISSHQPGTVARPGRRRIATVPVHAEAPQRIMSERARTARRLDPRGARSAARRRSGRTATPRQSCARSADHQYGFRLLLVVVGALLADLGEFTTPITIFFGGRCWWSASRAIFGDLPSRDTTCTRSTPQCSIHPHPRARIAAPASASALVVGDLLLVEPRHRHSQRRVGA